MTAHVYETNIHVKLNFIQLNSHTLIFWPKIPFKKVILYNPKIN